MKTLKSCLCQEVDSLFYFSTSHDIFSNEQSTTSDKNYNVHIRKYKEKANFHVWVFPDTSFTKFVLLFSKYFY